MPELVLGPMLRYLDASSATVWVETDQPATVTVRHADEGRALGDGETFTVAGHHYAIVAVEGLEPGARVPYAVDVAGERRWPLPGWPLSLIRPPAPEEPLRVAFGSCRAAFPLDDSSFGVDALHALAERMRASEPREWPHLLALVGDQVYADDNLSPETKRVIASRRGPDEGAGHEVANLDEYLLLYHESWSPPIIRWLLSTLPSAMIFDDHDIRDDWNTSHVWRRQMQATSWWTERITSGLLTYWLYQHLGNLSPAELAADPLLAQLPEVEDGEQLLRAHAQQADAAADNGGGVRWSYRRDIGRTRLVVLDSRCNRHVDGATRLLVNDREWAWFVDQCDDLSGVEHLLITTSLPYLLPPGVHALEAADEALASGRFGRRAADLGERVRQDADLEHWAAFGASFARMRRLLEEVASGRRGGPPATVTFLSGDVHFSYLAEAQLTRAQNPPAADGSRPSRILQAVSSPIRNPLPRGPRLAERLASSGVGHGLGRLLVGSVPAAARGLRWRVTRGPTFGDTLAELTLDGAAAAAHRLRRRARSRPAALVECVLRRLTARPHGCSVRRSWVRREGQARTAKAVRGGGLR